MNIKNLIFKMKIFGNPGRKGELFNLLNFILKKKNL